MDSRLIVIEILIVVIIALDHFAPALKSVRLCNQNIVEAFPRNVVSQEDSRHADALQLFIRRIRKRNQILFRYAFLTDQVIHAETEHTAELFQPSAVQHVIFNCCRRSAILVLRILSPDNQRDVKVHRHTHRYRENADMLRPGNVSYLCQSDAVELRTYHTVGRHFDVIHTHLFDILDVLSSDRCKIAGCRGHAERVHAQLQHGNYLIGTVFSATDRNNAVPV